MKFIGFYSGYIWGFLIFSANLWAFDGDWEIGNPDFQKDNFVDIKSYQPGKVREREWDEVQNGFRLVEGSLNLDISYLVVEARVRRSLSKRLTVFYHGKQEQFYAIKPLQQLVGLQFHLWDQYYVSAIGFPAYDKRRGDFGAALTLGQPPWNYLQFSHLKQDLYYNEKNFEKDRYLTEPVEDRLEGSYQSKRLKLQFDWLWDRAVERFSPDESLTLKNKGEDFSTVAEYQYSQTKLFGLRYRGFEFKKERLAPTALDSDENRQQNVQFLSTEFYWIESFSKYTLTTGTQYDRFKNRFRNLFGDLNRSPKSFNYRFETWQVYGLLHHPWSPNLSWEYGIYVGDAVEVKNRNSELEEDKFGRKLESKFRLSWEWHSWNEKSFLLLISTWDIDNFLNNFWDGGGVSIQIGF